MHLLNEGKESFLEFLRNLGPQIIILVVTIILLAKIEKTTAPGEWYKQLALLVVLGTTFGLAFLANLNNFIEKFTATVPEFKTHERSGEIGPRDRMKLLWSTRKSFFLELVIVMAIIEVSLVAVILSSIATSVGALNNLHIKL